jgi:hypothetical protein
MKLAMHAGSNDFWRVSTVKQRLEYIQRRLKIIGFRVTSTYVVILSRASMKSQLIMVNRNGFLSGPLSFPQRWGFLWSYMNSRRVFRFFYEC